MGYKHPALTELFVEVMLEEGTFAGNYSGNYFSLVPALRKMLGAGADELVPWGDPRGGALHVRSRLWSQDGARLIQLSPDLIVLNHVASAGTYIGWSRFFSFVNEALGVIRNNQDLKAESVALNTVDQVPVPQEAFQLGDYLRCEGEVLPQSFRSVDGAFDFIVGRGNIGEGSNRQLKLAVRETETGWIIRWDARFHERVTQSSGLENLLETLHVESNESFESMITQRTRDWMETQQWQP